MARWRDGREDRGRIYLQAVLGTLRSNVEDCLTQRDTIIRALTSFASVLVHWGINIYSTLSHTRFHKKILYQFSTGRGGNKLGQAFPSFSIGLPQSKSAPN